MTMPVAILAGGLAKRLRPATDKIPKALVSVAGRPFVEHQLELLRRQGYSRVVLCVGYLGEMIQAHLGDGSEFGLRVDYAFDGPTLLGTGGALRRALPKLGNAFCVLYGDSYLPCDFKSVEDSFARCGLPALMTVFPNDNRWDRSNAVFSGSRIQRYDKRHPSADMKHIDYGLGVMSAAPLHEWPGAENFDLGDVSSQLAAKGELAGFEVKERFYEIGSPAGRRETEEYLLLHSSSMGRT